LPRLSRISRAWMSMIVLMGRSWGLQSFCASYTVRTDMESLCSAAKSRLVLGCPRAHPFAGKGVKP